MDRSLEVFSKVSIFFFVYKNQLLNITYIKKFIANFHGHFILIVYQ
jgi:hypothetical protein